MIAGIPSDSHLVGQLEIFTKKEGYTHVANHVRLDFEANKDSILSFAVHCKPSEAEDFGFASERVELHVHALSWLRKAGERLRELLRHQSDVRA
jgi:hypothetical protein